MGRSRSAQKHRAQYLPVVARLCSHGGKPVRDHIPGTVLETATGCFFFCLFVFFYLFCICFICKICTILNLNVTILMQCTKPSFYAYVYL